jgi:hypothetical protein
MPARLHPGRVTHVWDHFVMGLRDGEGRTSLLSLYAVAWSPELGGGHVCVLDRPNAGRLVLADPVSLGERMQERLRALGGAAPAVAVTQAAFARHPAGADGLGWTIHFAGGRLDARWEGLEEPFWAEGPAPAFWQAEDIWASFLAASEATVVVDGRKLAASPYVDDAWTPKLGRPLSSAHVALAEVRVKPAAPP